MNTDFHIVIPARMASTRLPGKPLLDLGGKPMILRVYQQAAQARAASVTVATEDEEIAGVCRRAGADCELTGAHHQSGTDRVAEVAARRGWSDDDVVVNVQGDEPLLPPEAIRDVAMPLCSDRRLQMATLATPVRSPAELQDSAVVKVVCRENGDALYFSRAAIPFHREDPDGVAALRGALRHIGLYAYRNSLLQTLAATPVCPLEAHEQLEQLRVLWLGEDIRVVTTPSPPPPGVDTAADAERVRAHFQRR